MTLRPALAAALALPLAACISLGPKTPASLLTLTPSTPLAAGAAQTIDPARSVQVAIPTVPQALAASRVPVRASDNTIAYLKDAQWAESPNRLFRNLMAEVIAGRTGRPVLDPRQFTVAPGVRLSGGLTAFGLDAPSNMAVVTFDAMLTRADGTASARRFEARVPVAAQDTAAVAPALNQAANQVASDVADWIGG